VKVLQILQDAELKKWAAGGTWKEKPYGEKIDS
jgi:hypothetical protein